MQQVEPEQIPTSGPFAITPLAMDANSLASDVFYAAANQGHSALLDAAGLGVSRMFAPTHIYRRVYSLLPELAYGPRAALLDEAVRLWETEYLRRVRFVDMRDVTIEDPRVQLIAQRDPEDEPVAKLAALLGPCRLMSQDNDFIALGGSAGSDWRAIAVAGRNAMVPTQAIVVSSIPASLIQTGVSSGVDLLRAKPEWRLPVAFVFIVVIGFVAWGVWRADRTKWGENVGNFIADAAEKARPYVERYQQAKTVLREATIVPATDADPLNRVAHLLATSPRPLRITEISKALGARLSGVTLTPRQVGSLLRRARCFHRNEDSTWQVGYLAAPRRPRPAAADVNG